MRFTKPLAITLIVAAALTGGCGQTAAPGTDSSTHHFDDGTVFDASVLDAGPQQDAQIEGPACQDGVDNDDDGLIDYPEDPGCEDASDVDESNPPYCGLDSAGEMIEIRTIPPTGHLVQNTDHGHDYHEGSCGGAGAPEMVFSLEIQGNTSGVLINTIGTPTLLDTVVYVRKDDCDDPAAEVACVAPTGSGGVELGLADPAPGEYFIFVDGNSPGVSGQFLLEIRGLIPEGAPCDPSDLTLVCTPGLICEEPSPGQPTVCLVPLCSDGIDNDGDGIIDFPQEPGCESALDHTEVDTCPGVGCPACADGADNDNDGFTDWPADPGCTCAGDPIELDECLAGLQLTELPAGGTATGTIDPVQPSLTSGTCNMMMHGPETVYPLDLPFGALEVDITMQAMNFNAQPNIFVRQDDCQIGVEIGCAGTNWINPVTLSLTNLAPGTYFIFADSYEVWTNDSFTLTVEVRLPVGAPCEVGNPLAQCGPGGICQNSGGTWECTPTVCNNGVDDDLDGFIDYPNDPGCDSVDDNDEIDSCDPVNNPAACPVCFNGLDDDGDGLIDFPNDPGCSSAADSVELDECYPGVEVNELPPGGTVSGIIDQLEPSQSQSSCNTMWPGPEDVYAVDLPFGAVQMDISMSVLGWNAYPNIYVRQDDCPNGVEVGCIGSNYNAMEQLTVHNLAPGTYFIFADTYEVFTNDSYNLTVQVKLPVGASCTVGDPLFSCALGSNCFDIGGGVFECVGTACNNGLDDDGDGYFDYPNDPGCSDIQDNDEIDSCDPINNPAACPACFNGNDDDGDGLVDAADPGCTSAADTNELDECNPGLPFTNITSTGFASGTPMGMDYHTGSCGWSGYPEDVYLLWLTEPASRVDITLTGIGDYEPVVHARHGSCDQAAAEIGCAGPGMMWNLAELTLFNVSAGQLFLFADSNWIGMGASYNLTVVATLGVGATCDPFSTVVLCPAGTTCTDPGSGYLCQ